ncbi:hypothetical protein COCNU_03G015390 [Cocos nucifera]|uniref:Cytochrome P450 n=1 Tax=Cocos nucifera TaxID=13894 RepID=A0A8K0I517_COCNU|nr:hypothetical protein COCNU_03G015390 [Cocos nucifera]
MAVVAMVLAGRWTGSRCSPLSLLFFPFAFVLGHGKKRGRFRKIFTTSLFGNPAVVSADAELNRFIRQNEVKLFEHGWPQHVVKMIRETATPVAQGDAHKFQRSISSTSFAAEGLDHGFCQMLNILPPFSSSSWEHNSVIHAKDESMKDASGKAKPKHFMPFGGGMRQCPGEELAKLEIIVFTHHLILNYN